MLNLDLRALIAKLNLTCRQSLEGAAVLCMNQGNYEVEIEHVLAKLIEYPGQDFQVILRHYELDVDHVTKAIQRSVESGRRGNTGKPVFSPLLIEWFQDAWMLASVELGLGEVRSGVLIAALVANQNRFGGNAHMDALRDISPEDLRKHFIDITAGSGEEAKLAATKAAPGKGAVEAAAPRDETALGRFTIDFTGRARAGDIDPVFCRDREIRQIIDILGRRRKNNPIAVGEAGVGKTAVIEGLALAVVQGKVPDVLAGVEIYGLDLGLLQAGASVKGEFENRLKNVITEVKESPKPIILFIDEAHTLIGAGGSAGGSDAANLLKPALARGELRTIAATTWSEYKKYFEKDPALARRFQLVKLDEPSPEDAVVIIRGLRETYEKAHGVYVRDDAVEAAARLSARYISGRQLPDKAVDVLDTSAARVKISVSARPDALDDAERRAQTLSRERNAIARDVDTGVCPDDGRLAELDAEIAKLDGEAQEIQKRWEAEREKVVRILEIRKLLSGEAPESAESTAEGEEGAEQAQASADADADVAAATEAAPTAIDTAALKAELSQLQGELTALQGDSALVDYEVTPEVVGRVIADWTGIPLGKMVRDEAKTILTFGDDLRRRIKGQDHAVAAIEQGMRAAKAGIANPDTPMGVFLFVGPSGVGKTELALGVADILFGGERFMVTINMSEFQEKHTVSRLIGSPPGYVGYGEGGVLSEGVRQRPYSVVLLDEVEKADLEVMNLFYQVFDKGTLSDGEGRQIDFKNTICFLTSNLASDIITAMCADDEWPDPDTLMEAIRPVLSDHFKPALLARMQIVPFFPIRKDVMGEIVELKLNKVGKRLEASHKMAFGYSPEVVQQIAARCTEVETGARNIDYIINGNLLPHISTEILGRMGDETMPTRLQVGIGEDGEFTLDLS
jgi:type VI secretion system protein VasG